LTKSPQTSRCRLERRLPLKAQTPLNPKKSALTGNSNSFVISKLYFDIDFANLFTATLKRFCTLFITTHKAIILPSYCLKTGKGSGFEIYNKQFLKGNQNPETVWKSNIRRGFGLCCFSVVGQQWAGQKTVNRFSN
jgi:hypothetical protein